MVGISQDMCKVWKIVNNLMGPACTIQTEPDDPHQEITVMPLATVDNQGSLLAIYRGKLHFQIMEIRGPTEATKKDTVNLRRELIANGTNDFNFTP